MHIPVLQQEVMNFLAPNPNENFIDATIGTGGHAAAILERNGPEGKVLGIEIDSELMAKLRVGEIKYQKFHLHTKIWCGGKNIKNRLILVQDSYVNLKEIIESQGFKPVHGILFDLGISNWHLRESGRGFSFQKDEPLDMRYLITYYTRSLNSCYQGTAEEIVNKWPTKEIERVLKEYGEERFAKRIAKEIVEKRKREPIKTTFQLVEIIKKAVPPRYQRERIHFATRTFQALRIAVNNELDNLNKVLPQALEVLEKGGRMAVISFHSGEDKIVKNFFREQQKRGFLKILTKKPVIPLFREVKKNPCARSAKLRVAMKMEIC